MVVLGQVFSHRQVARRGVGRTSARPPEHFAPHFGGVLRQGTQLYDGHGSKSIEASLAEVLITLALERPVRIPVMSRPRLPLEFLPVWASFHNGILNNVEVKSVPDKGSGLVAKEDAAAIGEAPLISIPHSLVLNAEAVEEYAKEDRSFKQLLDACGHKVSRTVLFNSCLADRGVEPAS